jgi:hypothetical protein
LISSGEFTYSLAQACEVERNNPGFGLEYLLKQKRPEQEINCFKYHSILAAEFIEEIKTIFTNTEMIDIIAYHHEKSDGSGFPKGISYSGLCDFETFQMFCDYLIPFEEHVYEHGDGEKLIKENFLKLTKNENVSSLPINKIMSKWEAAMNWAIGYENEMSAEKNEEELEGAA